MDRTERLRAERALDAIPRTDDSQPLEWPAAAGRIREARLASGLKENEIADRLGLSVEAYGDLETYDDEAFTVATLGNLAMLGRVLSVKPSVLLLGPEAIDVEHTVTFSEIVERLTRRLADDHLTAEQLGDEIGFGVEPLLASPDSLWDYDVESLYGICTRLSVDWVAALPESSR